MPQIDMTIMTVALSAAPLSFVDEVPFTDLEPLMNSNQRTRNQFRPRAGKGGSASYQLRQYAEVTLGGGSLRKVVKLPEGEDENEWLAVNSEFDRVHMLVGGFANYESQWSISTTRSTFSMEPSPSSARHNRALR
jgi:MOB kinase activator 1